MRRRWLSFGVVTGIALLLLSVQARQSDTHVATPPPVSAPMPLPPLATPAPSARPMTKDAPALPEVPAMSEQSLRDEFDALQARLEDNSTDQSAIDRLSSMHALGFFTDEIVGFLVSLLRDHPQSYVLTVALADIYVRESSFQDAIALYEQAQPFSDGSLVIDFKLAHARLKSADHSGALLDARRMRNEVERRVKEKAAGKRPDEGISDAHVMMPCLLEAVAWAKQDNRDEAEKAIHDCGKGLLTPDQQAQLRATMTFDYDLLRDEDIDTILD